MRITFICFTFIFSLFVTSSFAQLKRANKYYDNYDYAKAIQLYKKIIKKNDNAEALEKIANSYRLTKNYQQAETYYARLMKQDTIAPVNHFFYGMVLKNINKIDEAKEQFKIYSNVVPNDKQVEISVQSCDDIKIWISKTRQMDITFVDEINTIHSEFGPSFYKNQLVFVSDRTKDMVNDNTYSWNKQPFLNVYSSEIKTDQTGAVLLSKKVKALSWQINSIYHDGPVCYNSTQNTMYLTRVGYETSKKDKNFVNRAKLFYSAKSEKSWNKVKPFQYNSDDYSVAHPSLSGDDQYLFFASDMPGGFGGMDIYFCKKEGDNWAQPQNLGSNVNTAGSEVFPYIRKDGMLFFSSDGHSGFGGLDVFSATKIDDKYSAIKNFGSPLNSSTDDFGIVFSDDNTAGYFSSDRTSGKGADDIYSFITLNNFLTVSGKILFSQNLNDPARNAKVMLIAEDGSILNVSITDSTGFFKFDKLDPDSKYLVKLDENDPAIAAKNRYYLSDEKGKIIRVTVINDKGGKFVFQNLPADPNSLPEIGGAEDVTIAGNLLFGENPSKPLANTKVNLVNDKGEILQTVTTNAVGAFVFVNLPSDQNFMVKVDEGDTELAPNTKISITNKNGKEMQSTTSGKNGAFNFSLLSADSNTLVEMDAGDDVSIAGNLLFGENPSKPLANKKVNLVNEKGEIIKTVFTDASGGFNFTDLPADQKYLVKVDESDPDLAPNTKITITNKSGKEMLATTTGNKGDFKFAFLAADKNTLKSMSIEDSELRFDLRGKLITENKSPLINSIINLINDKDAILQSTKTDKEGKFLFANLHADQTFSFTLDENDPELKKYNKLLLTNEKGVVVKEFTRTNGKFRFTILPSDQVKLGALYVEDTQLKELIVKNKITPITSDTNDGTSEVVKNTNQNDSSKTNNTKIIPIEVVKNTTVNNAEVVKNSTLIDNSMVIGTIYFNYGDYKILPEAKKTMDKLIDSMKNDKKLKIIISSHTDSRSSAGFNFLLSQKRNNSVIDYFVSKGIREERLTGKRYGETKLVNNCYENVECSEEEHAKNRRTEFKISNK
ncbi:MAG: hypothetical protein A3F72_02375 [Bacteroidetes bacterium RIFCSPLOWO2_12_FULL_35_15]|nr:MAG: hypothetical protein A3F72_02375 [Bacteroidetes bacterium RIFCSPLOWO2_12_FULL_35_15]